MESIEEDIKIFTGSGVAVMSVSYPLYCSMLWLWGRYLELRLIASAGVEYVDDYCIFLMTEFPGLALLALYYRWSQIGGLHIQGDGLAGERVSE